MDNNIEVIRKIRNDGRKQAILILGKNIMETEKEYFKNMAQLIENEEEMEELQVKLDKSIKIFNSFLNKVTNKEELLELEQAFREMAEELDN